MASARSSDWLWLPDISATTNGRPPGPTMRSAIFIQVPDHRFVDARVDADAVGWPRAEADLLVAAPGEQIVLHHAEHDLARTTMLGEPCRCRAQDLRGHSFAPPRLLAHQDPHDRVVL